MFFALRSLGSPALDSISVRAPPAALERLGCEDEGACRADPVLSKRHEQTDCDPACWCASGLSMTWPRLPCRPPDNFSEHVCRSKGALLLRRGRGRLLWPR